jgi:hypothetical protein
MPLLSSHRYADDCVCPTCADHRIGAKLRTITHFINWCNAPLLAGMRRASERQQVQGIDVPVELLRKNGFPLKHVPLEVKTLRLTDQLSHARA